LNGSGGARIDAAMKSLHRPDLYCWSRFDEARNVDFNSFFLRRPNGNLIVDPLPLSAHDRAHVESLGGAAAIVLTNSDHVRDTEAIRALLPGVRVLGPAGERAGFPIACDRWLGDGDAIDGIRVFALEGSKTPGELALLDGDTLITGDLVRAHRAGELMMLPNDKLSDRALAVASVKRLATLSGVRAILVGDGWPIFREGGALLMELAQRLG